MFYEPKTLIVVYKDEILAMLQDENFINDRKEDCDRIIDKMKLLRW